jgi:uncharacterized membrane protein YphA (DoxX/SURF4 family)
VRSQDRSDLAVTGLRVLMGVLWLSNLTWKLPPDFGRHDPRGLLYSFHEAQHHAISEPLRRFVAHVVIPHFTLFGWAVFTVEACAGVLLLLGWHTRAGAVVGLAQSIAITLLTVRAPDEWAWGYGLFVAVSLALVVAPGNRRWSVDARRGRRA